MNITENIKEIIERNEKHTGIDSTPIISAMLIYPLAKKQDIYTICNTEIRY
jgi:hypothetical protein